MSPASDETPDPLAAYRSIAGIHQLSPATAFDRYPTLFTALDRHVTPRRILSFGCSTGEECGTARKYWPTAEIVGVDVNPDSLETARRRWDCARFHHVSELPQLGTFDLALAMSVLCRHRDSRDVDDISAVYPFHLFEEAVGAMVDRLDPGGVLVIFNANYRFEDTVFAPGFRVLVDEDFADEGLRARVRRFGRDGRLLADQGARAVFVRV